MFSQNKIKIIDFGFAKKFYNATFTRLGTPGYAAPEVMYG